MQKTPGLTRTRIQRFHDDVIKPAIYGAGAPVSIAVFQCADPIPYAEAVRQTFTPVELGFRFGPKWSTAWFHITGQVPAAMAGQTVVLRFKSETEALVYWDGTPAQGMERNHDDFVMARSAAGGEGVDLFIECGVNTFFGAGGGSREDARTPQMNKADLPGHLHTCELAVLREGVRALSWDLEFLRSLENKLAEKSPRKRTILRAMNEAINALDASDIPGTAERARAILRPVIETPAGGGAGRCFAVGHAHIDTAWLWPLRETVRKCARTFSTQIALLEEYPDYVFMASQAQLYAFMRAHFPQLFERMRAKVQAGRWEAGGAMWVEADCNIPSGESLVRQILHGTRFWQAQFGVTQSYLWLPDVFGYSAALPQILQQTGLRYFVTQKISWSQFNKFPHHTFYWEGIDGTKLFSHFLPADTYNGSNYPDEIIHGQENNQDADRANMFLTAFGFGDGGGGPTRQHVEFVHRAENCDGLPRTQCSRVDHFLQTLEREATDLQTWVGELYLELHRGTFTTQARNKLANRQSEFLLRDAEFFAATCPNGPAYPAAELDQAWKLVLLNQFHDIIPGSSITWVYEDSREQYGRVRESAERIISATAATWTQQIDTRSLRQPVVMFNTLSWDDAGIVVIAGAGGVEMKSLRDAMGRVVSPLQRIETGGTPTSDIPIRDEVVYLARVSEVPPMGYAVFDLSPDPAPLNPTEAVNASVTGDAAILENRLLRVEIDGAGRVTRLFDKLARREVVDAATPANQLVLYEDRPNDWPAWDIDLFYLEKSFPITETAELRLVESGPLRATIEVTRPLGQASRLAQRISLSAESMRVDFATDVDWHENFRLLRVLHPVAIHSPRATYEIQFGHVERPTHFNTSWDYARFEVCAQKWADLSEPGYGVALLNAGKYGHSCHGNVLGLSLLRAPNYPDPTADRGRQHFTYSLLPHPGDWRERPLGSGSSVIQQAYRLNCPLRAERTMAHAGTLASRFSAISCNQPNVIIETIKKAEEGEAVIVRLYEAHGQRGGATLTVHIPFTKATAVDLLERPTDLYDLRAESRTIHLELTPFAIRTIALEK